MRDENETLQNETLQREAILRDPAFSLTILRFGRWMMIIFLLVGIALLIAFCVQAVIGHGLMSPSVELCAGILLVLWNAIVIALLRQNSVAIESIRTEEESMKKLR